MASNSGNVFQPVLAAWLDSRPKGSRAELARELDVTGATVTRWAQGLQLPQERQAAGIAQAIGEDEVVILRAIVDSRLAQQKARQPNRRPTVSQLARDLDELRQVVEALEQRIGQGARR